MGITCFTSSDPFCQNSFELPALPEALKISMHHKTNGADYLNPFDYLNLFKLC